MIVVVGGRTQGKLHFALEEFDISLQGQDTCKTWQLLDGNTNDLNDLSVTLGQDTPLILDHYEVFIRQQLQAGKEPDQELHAIVEQHKDNLLLICDEVGYGIVPMDKHDREYRECVGRTMCHAASVATEVWRVVAGIGMRIR